MNSWIKRRLKIWTRSKSLTNTKDRYKRKIQKLIYRKKYGHQDLIKKLSLMGVVKGDVVFVHSSWDEFYNYVGTPELLIDAILDFIGPEGTLAMPSYPFPRKTGAVFDLKRTPTAAGVLPEVFRTQKPVERSLDIHSVAAFGKFALDLTKMHIFSETSWDEYSPYYKLAEVKGKIISMGLGNHHVGTFMHCVESVLRKKYKYFELFFQKSAQVTFKDLNEKIVVKKYLTQGEGFQRAFTDKSHWGLIKRHFCKEKYRVEKISNLSITVFEADYAVHRAIELGKMGVVVYTHPSPKNYSFENQ